MRQCTKCGESKQMDAFPRLAHRTSGYDAICKLCINAIHRAWYARRHPGPTVHPGTQRKNGQTFVCKQCGTSFYLPKSQIGVKGRTNEWCSMACAYQGRRERSQRDCIWCGLPFYAPPSGLHKRLCCSRACSNAYRAVTPNATNRVKGSVPNPPLYGPNWRKQRVAALDRDGRACQHCGRGVAHPHVHHITPLRYFGEDYDAANALTNLITLCHPCHLRMEHTSGTYALERVSV